MSTGHTQEIELAKINPADHHLPKSHKVQALSDRYIRADVLAAELEKAWPQNWHLVTKLSYHVVIIPQLLTEADIRALQKKSAKLKKSATV